MLLTLIINWCRWCMVQTWKMLAHLLMKRKVVDYLYDEMQETAHLRRRRPEHSEWQVAEAVEGVLRHPCSVVTQSQSQHAHWLLPDAIASVSKLSVELRATLRTPVAAPPPDISPEDIDETTSRYVPWYGMCHGMCFSYGSDVFPACLSASAVG